MPGSSRTSLFPTAASSLSGPPTRTPNSPGRPGEGSMKRQNLTCFLLGSVLCLASVRAMAQTNQATPRPSDGHPDFTGLWIGQRAPFVQSAAPLAPNLASRDGTLLNFERDNALIRRSDPNKPLYKPEFWEKVQKLDQNGNTEDPPSGCMPSCVPRMGPPAKILQTPKEMVFLYISAAA